MLFRSTEIKEASPEKEQLMRALLADLARRTAQERLENPNMCKIDRHRWRRERVELMFAELEPAIAFELKYPSGCPCAPHVQEGQPKRTQVDKSVHRLQCVGGDLTVIVENTIVVLCRGV